MGVSKERMQTIRKKLDGTGLEVDEHRGRYRFGYPPDDPGPGDHSYFALSNEHTAEGLREAEAFAAGVQATARTRRAMAQLVADLREALIVRVDGTLDRLPQDERDEALQEEEDAVSHASQLLQRLYGPDWWREVA